MPISCTPQKLALPIELLRIIIALSLCEYLNDIMFFYENSERDTIMTFLHVSYNFQELTIQFLYHLWGEVFIGDRKM
jgi:hypothetical protein